jgi:hypothetical protein
MTYNNDDLKQLKMLWQAEEEAIVDLQFPIPEGPQLPLGAVPIPISSSAREKADRMAALCPKTDRREIMRRNLLATIAVHDYLRLQGYLPDLLASDCWSPILGRMGDGADLMVSQVGRLECCAMGSGQSSCPVPSEGQFTRAGYVAVELDAEEHWGWLLGFMPGGDEINPVETLNRADLQSMDDFGYLLHRLWLLWTILQQESEPWDAELRGEIVTLLDRIYRKHSAAQRPMRAASEITEFWGEEVTRADPRELVGTSREGDSSAQPELSQFLREVFDRLEEELTTEEVSDERVVNLSQWFNLNEAVSVFRGLGDQVREGWQNLEALFSMEELTPAFSMRGDSMRMRSGSAERAKLIRLTTEVMQQEVVLIVNIHRRSERDSNIIVEVRASSGQQYLPATLQVQILDDRKNTAMEAIASSTNKNIQFDFDVTSGERFSIQMTLMEASVTEEFIV